MVSFFPPPRNYRYNVLLFTPSVCATASRVVFCSAILRFNSSEQFIFFTSFLVIFTFFIKFYYFSINLSISFGQKINKFVAKMQFLTIYVGNMQIFETLHAHNTRKGSIFLPHKEALFYFSNNMFKEPSQHM